jgi:L-amino acid N-acyltransferase YncA
MGTQSNVPVEIRLATVEDANAIAKTHVASWKAAYPGIVPQEYIDSLSIDEFADRWQNRLITPSGMKIYVADCVGTICGFASGGPARAEMPGFSGELYAIYLNPEACFKGIGSRLFWGIAKELQSSGHRSMYVWVLRDNPSRGFYERMGGNFLDAAEIEIGGKTLTEVSYGWQDLTAAALHLPQS